MQIWLYSRKCYVKSLSIIRPILNIATAKPKAKNFFVHLHKLSTLVPLPHSLGLEWRSHLLAQDIVQPFIRMMGIMNGKVRTEKYPFSPFDMTFFRRSISFLIIAKTHSIDRTMALLSHYIVSLRFSFILANKVMDVNAITFRLSTITFQAERNGSHPIHMFAISIVINSDDGHLLKAYWIW